MVHSETWLVEDSAADFSLVLIRVAVGVVFLAHGYNHLFGGGRILGTARWFESIGLRHGTVNAWLATWSEIAAGIGLVLGLAFPLACAAGVGTMLVAWVTNHHRNGFFIFRPGEGYEYVMVLTVVSIGLAGLGPGRWSIDETLGWSDPDWIGLCIAGVAGVGGAVLVLATCWRPSGRR